MPNKKDLLDLQFIQIRHQLVELAAFLDRIDRHSGVADNRLAALKSAIPILMDDRSDRAAAILNTLSDHSLDLPESAPFQGAYGAPL